MARNRLLPAPPAARRLSVLALLVLCITAWNLNAASAAADAGGAKDWSNEKQGVHVLNVTNFDSSLRDGKVWLIEVRRFRFWKVPMKRSGPDCIRPSILHVVQCSLTIYFLHTLQFYAPW